jgi:hypothetical protein
MKKITLFLLAAAVLSGCSTPSSLSPSMQADLKRPIFCDGASECKVMWKRAFQFVSLNAGYPIKTANAAFIETERFTAPYLKGWQRFNDKTAVSMKVLKSPLGGGRYQVRLAGWCASGRFGQCNPAVDETLWRAKLFIREGKE